MQLELDPEPGSRHATTSRMTFGHKIHITVNKVSLKTIQTYKSQKETTSSNHVGWLSLTSISYRCASSFRKAMQKQNLPETQTLQITWSNKI